jgi:tripartite-type tricarboxylate transporter receptor subunit TctC
MRELFNAMRILSMRSDVRVLAAAFSISVACGAHAQPEPARYPTKPVRVICPFPPGGGADGVARMLVPELSEVWRESVIVDNRPGAGGSIGTEMAARSPPDGYTLVMATASTIVINPLVSKVAYDPMRDFAPVAHTSTVPLVLVVHPSVPAKNVKELIAYVRSSPGRVNYSSSGEGTISHLTGELLKNLTHVDMVHVPYRGGGQAIIDLVAGHVQVGFQNMLEAVPQIKAGRLRALGVSTPARSPAMPNVPTIAESGIPGFDVIQWSGVLAPTGVPRGVISKWNAEVNRILARAEIRERLAAAGADAGGGPPEQFGKLIRTDIMKWAKLVKTIGVRLQR